MVTIGSLYEVTNSNRDPSSTPCDRPLPQTGGSESQSKVACCFAGVCSCQDLLPV